MSAHSKGMFLRFRDWCAKTGTEASPGTLMEWDAKHNEGLIRARWSRDYVLRIGYETLFERFFYKYAMIYPVRLGGTIAAAAERLAEGGVSCGFSGIRQGANGLMVDFGKAPSAADLRAVVESLKKEMRRIALRLKVFGLPKMELIRLVDEAYEQRENADAA